MILTIIYDTLNSEGRWAAAIPSIKGSAGLTAPDSALQGYAQPPSTLGEADFSRKLAISAGTRPSASAVENHRAASGYGTALCLFTESIRRCVPCCPLVPANGITALV